VRLPSKIIMKIIGVSSNWLDNEREQRLVNVYIKCISDNGGIPLILPVTDNENVIRQYCEVVDAFLLTGGGDINSKYWGEELTEMSNTPSEARDFFDITLTRYALQTGKKVLGICRGMQSIAIVTGGSLFQDIYRQMPEKSLICHSQKTARSETHHKVNIAPESMINTIMGVAEADVNSFHHQAVKTVGEGCNVVARATDGVIEGIELAGLPVVGVQWHPEELFGGHEEHRALFNWLML